MSNSSDDIVTRSHSSSRLSDRPPAPKRSQQQRPQQRWCRADSVENERRTAWEEPTLASPNLASLLPSPAQPNFTNLDRIIETFTPAVPAQRVSEAGMTDLGASEDGTLAFFTLEDFWGCYETWSVFGVGVPLQLNEGDTVQQYYVPFLSGIQLFIDPQLSRLAGKSDAESSRQMSSANISASEVERGTSDAVDNTWGQHGIDMDLASQRSNELTLTDRSPVASAGNGAASFNSPGKLVFEYLEREPPHCRKPLFYQVSSLAARFPELKKSKSCDLMPSSWVSVAWYPIYRIPVGETLQSSDTCFLTFHTLSTIYTGEDHPCFQIGGRKAHEIKASSKFSLCVFGLASYKLRSTILAPDSATGRQLVNSLFRAAEDWVNYLQVKLPDLQFFISRSNQQC